MPPHFFTHLNKVRMPDVRTKPMQIFSRPQIYMLWKSLNLSVKFSRQCEIFMRLAEMMRSSHKYPLISSGHVEGVVSDTKA